ncbi:hypothetical protein [Paenarthrobacter ureafaciens]|uniref:hypothetical protein n=1 Tax=Paenarthrobacter ureafaciens TaxID=37931 RepID=UPI00196B9343|nr:hypothetical protein [Paenarthrobacter ureafaciens]MCX8453219.1 hypothetical protein [Paenarthrobacter ureafaciens]MCY0972800.1 hypothetical protein [Paenarthrobacter ureafaciens]
MDKPGGLPGLTFGVAVLGFLTVVVLLFLAGLSAGAYALGMARGRRVAGSRSSGVKDDVDAYRAAYLAGHLAGWQDAVAKTSQARQGEPALPQAVQPTAAAPPSVGTQAAPVRPAPVRPVPVPPAAPRPVHGSPVQGYSLYEPLRPAAGFAPPQGAVPQRVVLPAPIPKAPEGPGQRQPPPQAAPPWQGETPQHAAQRKEKRDRQNINITLYVASLLLVAAGALFVGTSLPESLRFVAIWLITVLFYAAGLVLHPRVPRLRPAAMAFTGTGLALVPVTGLAMYSFALHNGPLAWLVTSVLGTIAYVYAAIRLDNKVLAALSLSFVVSTAWSGVSVLGGALVWYFTALIGVAVLLTLAAILRPRWIPPLYIRPLMALHPFVVPAVGVAATLTPNLMARGEYSLVMAMCGTYFVVMLWVPDLKFRTLYFYAARAAFSLAIIAVVWDATGEVSQALLAAVLCLGIQALILAFGGQRISPKTWWTDAVSCLGLQLVVALVLAIVLAFSTSELPAYTAFYVVLATSMPLGWKLRGGVAFAPAAVVASASSLAPMLGAWPLFAMFASSGLFWFGLALRAQGVYRKALVLSGRIALSLAVPFLITALYPERPDVAALTALALVVVCAAQQVLGAAFERWGVGLLAPQISALAFGGVGITALAVLTVLDKAPGHPVVAAGAFAVLAGGLVAGMLAFPPVSPAGRASRAGSGASESWRPNGMEFLAPAAGMVSAVVGAAVVSRGLGNLALLALATYFAVTALRLPASMHRRCYWWLARATATVLAASVYLDLSSAGYALSVGGEEAALATVIVWVLGAQLVAVVVAGRKAMSLGLLMVDAGVLLALMSIATAALRFPALLHSAPHDGWQPGAAAIITAAAALVAAVMLRKHRLAWLLAPAAMHLLLVRGHNVRDVEVLLGLFTTYAGFMVALTREARLRGAYLLAGRVLFTAFAAIVVADATESAAAASLALAGLVFIQIALHPIVRRRFDGSPLLEEALWAGLVVQLLLPCWYLWARDFDGGGRWVVLCELTLAIVAAAIVWRDQRHAAALYAGVFAVAGVVVGAGPALTFPSGTWLHQAVLSELHVPAVLLGLAAGLTALRVFLGRLSTSPAGSQLKWTWFASALFFASVAGIFSVDASRILSGLAVLTVALVFYAASHLEDRPRFYAAAASTTLVGAVTGVEGWLNESGATTAFTGAWPDLLPWLVGGVGTGLILYVWRLLGGPAITAEPWRRYSLSATTGAGLLATAILGLVHDETAFTGAFLTAAAAVLLVVEIPVGKHLAAEVGTVVVLVAFQRAVIFVDSIRPDWFWAAQWFVVAGAVLAGLRYKQKQRSAGRLRLGMASGILSLSSLATIFAGTPSQQIYVLAAHAVLLGAGLLLSERLFVGWGAVGVAASVMWALRSYAFAMLALVAIGLIVLAVWRLNRRPQEPGVVGPKGGEHTHDRVG